MKIVGTLWIDFGDGRAYPLAPLDFAQGRLMGKVQAEAHIVFEIEPGQQARVLKNKTKPRMRARQQFAFDMNSAFVGILQARQYAQKRRLSHPARADRKSTRLNSSH